MRTILILILITAGLQMMCSSSATTNQSKGISVEDILEKIQKGEDVYVNGETFSEPLDFTQLASVLANVNYYSIAINSQLTFENCTFKEPVFAYRNESGKQYACHFQKGLSFMGCTFRKDVSFKGAIIQGLTNFAKSYFEQEAHFEGATFQSEANFSNTIYLKDIFFQQARFTKSATFMQSNLGGIASFQGCQFDGNLQLGVCEFHEYADFSKVHFNGGCFADYGKFYAKAMFTNATFRDRADFKGCEFNQLAAFKGSVFYGNTRFNESSFKEGLDLRATRFIYGAPETRSLKIEDRSKIELENAQYNSYQPIDLSQL